MGLEVLGKLDAAFTVVPRDKFVDWIYNLQVIPDGETKEGERRVGSSCGGLCVVVHCLTCGGNRPVRLASRGGPRPHAGAARLGSLRRLPRRNVRRRALLLL